jgi:cytochrome bd-type quinol oxidase subunit 2
MGLRVIPIMFLGYLGLAFSLWPNIVPPSGLAMATIDKHQAASTRWY